MNAVPLFSNEISHEVVLHGSVKKPILLTWHFTIHIFWHLLEEKNPDPKHSLFWTALLKVKICKHLFENRIVAQAPFWLLSSKRNKKILQRLFPIAQFKADQTLLSRGHFFDTPCHFSMFQKRSTAFSIILLCRERIFTAWYIYMSGGDYCATKFLPGVNLTGERKPCRLTRFKEIWKSIVELEKSFFFIFFLEVHFIYPCYRIEQFCSEVRGCR